MNRSFSFPGLTLKRWILLLVLGLSQLSIIYFVWPFTVKPDLLLILVVIMAARSEFREIAGYVLFCGLIKDAFGLRLFGFNSLLFSLEAFLVGYLCRRLYYQEKAWFGFVFLASAGLLNYLVLTIILKRPYILTGLVEAAINCLFFPAIEKLYALASRRLS